MNIKELAEKYKLGKDDFWEHRKGTWIIKHDACMKIAHIEGIDFDKPEYNYNIPTTFTENGEKVQQVKYGRESWKPAWAGTCQKHTGGVIKKTTPIIKYGLPVRLMQVIVLPPITGRWLKKGAKIELY